MTYSFIEIFIRNIIMLIKECYSVNKVTSGHILILERFILAKIRYGRWNDYKLYYIIYMYSYKCYLYNTMYWGVHLSSVKLNILYIMTYSYYKILYNNGTFHPRNFFSSVYKRIWKFTTSREHTEKIERKRVIKVMLSEYKLFFSYVCGCRKHVCGDV